MNLLEFSDIARETWAAVGGGIVGAIVDSGPFLKRTINGCGSIMFAIIFAPAIMSVMPVWLNNERIAAAVAAGVAIVGVVLAEALQRIARATLRNPEGLGEKLRQKLDKKVDDA